MKKFEIDVDINGTITFDPKVKKGVKAVLRFPL